MTGKASNEIEVKNDEETSKKWSQSILLPRGTFLFKENTKKLDGQTRDLTKKEKTKKNVSDKEDVEDEDEKFQKIRADKEHKRNYLSTISAKFNPDLLIGGENGFIRGNEYYSGKKKKSKSKKAVEPKERAPSDEEESSNHSEGDEDDLLETMKKLGSGRYWTEENIAVKCHNCREFGHLAKECPNETKKPACILCTKDTHDSFNCTEKMCFRCNGVGH